MTSVFSALTSLSGFNILENSAATPGLWNVPYGVIDRNFSQLQSDSSAAVSDVSTYAHSLVFNTSGLSGVVNVGLPPYLATGLGVLSEHTRFAAAVAAVGPNGVLLIPSGTYKFTSISTISCAVWPMPGAVLQPSGITLPITGSLAYASPVRWLDTSLGGYSFGSTHLIKGEWFVRGNGTDDAPALNAAVASLPSDARLTFETEMDLALYSTWTAQLKRGPEIESLLWPFPDGDGVNLLWRGPYGGTMVGWDRVDGGHMKRFGFKPNDDCLVMFGGSVTSGSSVLTIQGFQPITSGYSGRFVAIEGGLAGNSTLTATIASWQSIGQVTLSRNASNTTGPVRVVVGSTATSGPPLVCMDIDQVVAGDITCTANWIEENLVKDLGFIAAQVGFRVAEVSSENCEFFKLLNNTVTGGFSPTLLSPIENGVGITFTSGSSVIASNALSFTSSIIGARFLGAHGLGAGTRIDTVITGLIGPSPTTQATMKVNASYSTTSARAILIDTFGTAFKLSHSNSINHVIDGNHALFVDRGIHLNGASADARGNTFSGNNVDFYLEAGRMVSFNNDMEQSRQHLKTTGAGTLAPIEFVGGRCAPIYTLPNGSLFDCGGQLNLEVRSLFFDGTMPSDGTYFNLAGSGSRFDFKNLRFSTNPTLEQAGFMTLASDAMLLWENNASLTGSPALNFVKIGSALLDFPALSFLVGRIAMHAPSVSPNDSFLTVGQITPWLDETNHNLTWRVRTSAGVLSTSSVSYK